MYITASYKQLPGGIVSQLLLNMNIPDATQDDFSEKKPFQGRKKIRYACRDQVTFDVKSLDDLIPEDHRARDVWEYTSQLDFSEFRNEIQVPEGGRGAASIDPQILITLWLYALLNGICSARLIARLSQEHHAYIWICGGVSLNYHTLSDFRTQGGDKFRTLLQESIALIWRTGVFQPDTAAQDGTRVKANAGFTNFRREKTLSQYIEEANQHIKNLEKEIAKDPSAPHRRGNSAKQRAATERKVRIEKAQEELKAYRKERIISSKENHNKFSEEDQENMRVSITDPEARKMKMGDGGYRLAYNVQFATETNKKVVLGVDVVNTQDPGTLSPMMHEVEQNLNKIGCPMVSNWLADSAYANKKDMQKAEADFPNVTFYSPPTTTKKGADPLAPRKDDNAAMINLKNRMKSEKGKAAYAKRSETAEFVNAVAKNRGMGEFLVRGLNKVKNMALLYAVAHNMTIFLNNG